MRDTPSYGSDHLCQIWNESIQNCWCYRADTACGTDGRTDGQTDRRSETNIPPTTLLCGGIRTLRTYSKFAPSQWEMALLCNAISHWLGANLESALTLESILPWNIYSVKYSSKTVCNSSTISLNHTEVCDRQFTSGKLNKSMTYIQRLLVAFACAFNRLWVDNFSNWIVPMHDTSNRLKGYAKHNYLSNAQKIYSEYTFVNGILFRE